MGFLFISYVSFLSLLSDEVDCCRACSCILALEGAKGTLLVVLAIYDVMNGPNPVLGAASLGLMNMNTIV